MTNRIDYNIVGQEFINQNHQLYKVISYDGRDFKSKKHFYTIEFKCGDTTRTYSNQHYKQVVEGKCKDLEQIKLDSRAKRQAKIKKKFACSKKSIEHYERIPDLSSKVCMSIDGSTKCTGYCISQNSKIITTGEIKADRKLSTRLRMGRMRIEIENLIQKYKIEVVFCEDVIFKNVNVMKILGRLQGHIESIVPINCRFVLINPSSWKNFHAFNGKRAEQKKQSIKFASRLMGKIMGEDEADATCMMIYCVKTLELKEAG